MNFDEKASGKLREMATTQHFTPSYPGRIHWWLRSSSTLRSISWRQMGKVRSCGLHSPSTRPRGEPGGHKRQGGRGTGTAKEMLIPSAVIHKSWYFPFWPGRWGRWEKVPLPCSIESELASKYNLATPQAVNSQGKAVSTLVMAQEHFVLASLSWYKPSM